MSDVEGRPRGDTVSGHAGDVTASEVTIRQGGARSVAARQVTIRQGGAVRIQAQEVDVRQGGVVLARGNELGVIAGGVVAAIADTAKLEQSCVQMAVARESVEMDQVAGGLVLAKTAQARDSAIGLLLAREFHGEGVRVLIDSRAAFAFGAGLGLAVGLTALLRGQR
jgi:hypothetical protein